MKVQPWHEDAIRLKAAGRPYVEIAEEVGRSVTSVCRFFNPEYRAAQQATSNERNRRRWADDPEMRRRSLESCRRRRARLKAASDLSADA